MENENSKQEPKMANNNPYAKRPAWQWLMFYLIIGGAIYGLLYYFVIGKRGEKAYSSNSPSSSYQQTSPSGQANTSPQNDNAISSQNNQQSSVQVTLRADGYSPNTITVKAGTTVVWTNKSGTSATVSSDMHPTHLLYPMLNLGKFDDGQSLSLVFTAPGTYTYHNHLKPSDTGTVIVQ